MAARDKKSPGACSTHKPRSTLHRIRAGEADGADKIEAAGKVAGAPSDEKPGRKRGQRARRTLSCTRGQRALQCKRLLFLPLNRSSWGGCRMQPLVREMEANGWRLA
jgi:hypothetical protein